jgi:hypothetical protein
MKDQAMINQARQLVASLKSNSKAQVFSMWCTTCLGSIHCASIKEQRKGWMIYDIVSSKYGKAVAGQVS